MPDNTVSVVRGTDKFASFSELLSLTKFDEALSQAQAASGKTKEAYRIVIKPNMMVFVSRNGYEATVTDWTLVEYLVDHIIAMGFTNIALCEAQHDVGRMFKNHNVAFVADQIGYRPQGRYRIADLTLESQPYSYEYVDKGKSKLWKDVVGTTWRDADYRISFAKLKTHEHDWMTLTVKNIYGCFAASDKVQRYHMKNEVWEVTSRSLRNFPIHFAFLDGWIASDGFQGYKVPRPKPLQMLMGGANAIAVDMEAFKRAGLDSRRSRILNRCVEQTSSGIYPDYTVAGDTTSMYKDICDWTNIEDGTVQAINHMEEVYIGWALINLKPGAEYVDYKMFPPKNIGSRLVVWASKKFDAIFKLTWLYKKWYGKPDPAKRPAQH